MKSGYVRSFLNAFVVLLFVSMLIVSLTTPEVRASHVSSIPDPVVTKVDSNYKYPYKVKNVAGSKDSIVKIEINKTDGASFVMTSPAKGWKCTDKGTYVVIESEDPKTYRITPGHEQDFTLYSPRDNKSQEARTYDDAKPSYCYGPTSTEGPDTEKPKGQGYPRERYVPCSTYGYSVLYTWGNVSSLWIFLDPLVIVESVSVSDPDWYWYRYTTGDEAGILVFETTSKPVNATNPEVSITFRSPNSVHGEVSALMEGYGGDISGPVPAPVPVGGYSVLTAKPMPDLLASYIGLASTIIVAAIATAVYVKRVKRRKEKQ